MKYINANEILPHHNTTTYGQSLLFLRILLHQRQLVDYTPDKPIYAVY